VWTASVPKDPRPSTSARSLPVQVGVKGSFHLYAADYNSRNNRRAPSCVLEYQDYGRVRTLLGDERYHKHGSTVP
jgi:hypothetical protein